MTKIDIISGFLGAGKTTLIKKLLKEALSDEQVVLIENEFGEIAVDGGFLKEAGIEIKEMNSGCICCSLVGDFAASLKEVMKTYSPERILIEPSGVGKLSDVIKAVQSADLGDMVQINSAVTVVDASKCKMYMKNFGEFFTNQIAYAGTIILSRTDNMSEEKLNKVLAMIREQNSKAEIITTSWEKLNGKVIVDAMEGISNLEKQVLEMVRKESTEEHHHDHEEHHHDHEEHHHDHEEHHHDHEGHQHGPECSCGCHDHEEHHHAEEIFTSWGAETPNSYTMEEIKKILNELEDEKTYGFVLRAKGMLPTKQAEWIYFDYVPGEVDIRSGQPNIIGKICVIGSKLQQENLGRLFLK
jgi:G3E family GTPase